MRPKGEKVHAWEPGQMSSSWLSLHTSLTPPCHTLTRHFPHGHFLFCDILMSEWHQSLQIGCQYVLSPALKMCGLKVAESKSPAWQALITAGAHRRLETSLNPMPVTQRGIWESCQDLPRIVLFHLNSPHFFPLKADVLLHHHLNCLTLPFLPSSGKVTGFFSDLPKDIMCRHVQIDVGRLVLQLQGQKSHGVRTRRVFRKLSGYHQVPRPKED